jgi:ATPase family AAA domain-containing protein 2
MEQINRKYKTFRQAPIPQSHFQYLFDERDPNYVVPDIAGAIPRPYEIATDKDGVQGLRQTETGKFFYNMDIQTIEERLANGFYIKPSSFLRDIRALEKDAKASGDRQRILKASELLTNVEVDVGDIEKLRLPGVDWEGMYERENRRRMAKAEKSLKKKALQSVLDQSNSNAGNADSSIPKLATTDAHFQVMSPPPNGLGECSQAQTQTNGTSFPSRPEGDDVQMTDADSRPEGPVSPMRPPTQWPQMTPRPLTLSTMATPGGTAQLSQVSAVQTLPPGVSPSALANDTSTTKTSDPSNRSSNWSTQVTNGVHHEQSSPVDQLPDTQPLGSQGTSSEDQWLHSQAHALARGAIQAPGYSQVSRPNGSLGETRSHAPSMANILNESSHAPSMANILNDPSPDEATQSTRLSLAVEMDESSGSVLLEQLTMRSSGCTIEQLEQLNREMMAEIWRTRGEHNRMKVLSAVTRVFNESIHDIESMQRVFQASQ